MEALLDALSGLCKDVPFVAGMLCTKRAIVANKKNSSKAQRARQRLLPYPMEE
jgi:hypothetical protein